MTTINIRPGLLQRIDELFKLMYPNSLGGESTEMQIEMILDRIGEMNKNVNESEICDGRVF